MTGRLSLKISILRATPSTEPSVASGAVMRDDAKRRWKVASERQKLA